MSVLSACQTAGLRIKGESVGSLFSTPSKFAAELANLANEVVSDILERHDWRRLAKTHTITGDGSDTAFPLPADYDRMPLNAKLYASSSQTPLTPIRDPDQLVQFTIDPVIADPGCWGIFGGALHILPALGNGATVKFAYQSTYAIAGGTKPAFTADADSFDLDPRLLTLGLIWRWRAQKRLEYAEDLVNFENAVTARAGRDKGARILKIGVPRNRSEVNVAYPGTITP
jgi:hypothetical protein